MSKLTDWLIDYAHMIKGGSLMYVHRTPPGHYLEYIVKGKVPIIILPGIFGRWAFLKPLGDYLSLRGHPVYIVPKLGNNVNDIPASAEKVREMIDEAGIKEVIIVAHSKGGLIGKYLLLHDNEKQDVDGLVAIATPFSGSALSKPIPYHAIKELSPVSQIILDLTQHTSINNKIVSIIPGYDNHVWHEAGSYLDGALANIHVNTRGHHKVTQDKTVWEVINKAIDLISGNSQK
jgi:triacylglycerol lipase